MSWLNPVLAYPHCPRIQVSGSCCSKCAEGKPCCSLDEELTVKKVGDAPSAVVSSTPWEEVVKSDELVRRFNAEVVAAPDQAKFGSLPLRWNMFFANWQVFFDAANRDADSRAIPLVIPKMITNQMADSGLPSFKTQYEKNVLDFNGFVDEFKKLGGVTTVAPIDTSSPAYQAARDLLAKITGAAGSAADAATTALIYLAVIGAVGGAAWYFGPVLVSKLMKSRPR